MVNAEHGTRAGLSPWTRRSRLGPCFITAALLCFGSSVACSAEQRVAAPSNPTARVVAPTQAPAQTPGGTRAAEPEAMPVLEAAQSNAVNGILLPSDDELLAASLPAKDVSRYATFRELKQVNVGHSTQQLDKRPYGPLIALGATENGVDYFDAKSMKRLGTTTLADVGKDDNVAVVGWPSPVADSADRPQLLVASPSGLHLVDASTGERLHEFSSDPTTALEWSNDGQVLVCDTKRVRKASGELEQFSALRFFVRSGDWSLEERAVLQFDDRVDDWALSTDNRLLAVVLAGSGDLRVLDLHTGKDVMRQKAPQYSSATDISPDGRFVAVGGEGLAVIDLLNPERRAYYSHLFNNIGHVRFAPAGDVVAASSYDGRVRLFELRQTDDQVDLLLTKELRHNGSANVYAFMFDTDGSTLTSVSGDQTLRRFAASRKTRPSVAPARKFLTLDQWRAADPAGAAPLPPAPEPKLLDGHYLPAALEQAALPSRIGPGLYWCRLTRIYRMRDCWVRKDEAGHTLLYFADDNLLPLMGVLFDDGAQVRFEGWLTQPSNLVSCDGCERQPIVGLLRGSGKTFHGVVGFREYYDPRRPTPPLPANVPIEEALDSYPLDLQYRGPLEPTRDNAR
jgi:WD40 repeat protein